MKERTMSRSVLGRDFFLKNASPARVREAEQARNNRAEIVRAYSHGQVSRRDLVKLGFDHRSGPPVANPRLESVCEKRIC